MKPRYPKLETTNVIYLAFAAFLVIVGGVIWSAATERCSSEEARNVLRQVHTLQTTFYWGNGHYCKIGQLATKERPFTFVFLGGSAVTVEGIDCYKYLMVGEKGGYTCTAYGNLDDDDAMDIWRIDQTGNLVHVVDDKTAS